MATAKPLLPEALMGPAEKLLDLVLSSSAHLWHNRPGIEVNGLWAPRPKKGAPRPKGARDATPGLHLPLPRGGEGRGEGRTFWSTTENS